jgi:hypothetical protein
MNEDIHLAHGFVARARELALGLGGAALPPTLPIAGAAALSRVLLQQPAMVPGHRPDAVLQLFGDTDDPMLQALRSEAVGLLIVGSLALGMQGQPLKKLAAQLVLLSADLSPEALDLRARLWGLRPVGPSLPTLPAWKGQIDAFIAARCFAGVQRAVLALGAWASQRPTADAHGIASLSGGAACGGGVLHIQGGPFGPSAPPDVAVHVPLRGGGCREAKIIKWSDATITVELPPDIGPGCVGFVRGKGGLLKPQRLIGELVSCIGPAAEAWTRGLGRIGSSLVSCPPCLPGGQNRLTLAGKPIIHHFVCTPHVEPGGQPVLSWRVDQADAVEIVTRAGPSPGPAAAAPLPLTGSLTLPPVTGTSPVTGLYELVATNACGETRTSVDFVMSRTPSPSITVIEVVQSIQRPDNSVPLVEGRRAIVRVFVDSGLTDGFDHGVGAGVIPVDVTLQAENLDTGVRSVCPTWWAGTGWAAMRQHDRDKLAHSHNFEVPLAACTGHVRFHARARSHAIARTSAVDSPTASVEVRFTPVPVQPVLPFIINDPGSAQPQPQWTDFLSSLAQMADIVPRPMSRMLVHLPISVQLTPQESPTDRLRQFMLATRLATTVFLFPSTPVHGLRAGIIANDGAYPMGGVGLPRLGPLTPTFIAKASQAWTWAHEWAHAYGVEHVPNTDPADPTPEPPWYDMRLPQLTEEPGVDFGGRALAPAGTNELMSYARRRWISIAHWEILRTQGPV